MDYQLVEVSIELTRACKLACMHCSSEGGVVMPNELAPGEVISILDQARELGATVVSFSGGDPILDSNISEYVGYAAGVGFEKILLYTEGVFSVESGDVPYMQPFITTFQERWQVLDALVNSAGNKLTVIFSLHSHEPATHDYITQVVGSYYAVVDNIRELRIYPNIGVEVHMVPMRPNMRHIPQVRDMCADLGVHKMSVLRFVPQGRGKHYLDQLGMTVEMFAEMQHIISNEMMREHPVKLRIGCPINFVHTIRDDIHEKLYPCHAGKDLILVRPDGVVHPCAAWKTLPADDNIRTRTLEEIWHTGTVFKALRAWHEYMYKSVKGLCRKCGYQSSCHSGCPAQRLHATGAASMEMLSVDMPDPLCPMLIKHKR